MEEIRFKDLSIPLKFAAIAGFIFGLLVCLLMAAFVSGILYAAFIE